jgi:rubrerythrin
MSGWSHRALKRIESETDARLARDRERRDHECEVCGDAETGRCNNPFCPCICHRVGRKKKAQPLDRSGEDS